MKPLPLILSLSLMAPMAHAVDYQYTVHGLRESSPIVEEINQARATIRYELVLDIQRQVHETLSRWGEQYQLTQESEEEEVQSAGAADVAFAPRHCQP